MDGVGELFGSAFDDVLRRPSPALVPAVTDVALLLAGGLILSLAGGGVAFLQAPQGLPDAAIAVPEALSSVADLDDPVWDVRDAGGRGALVVLAAALVALPVAAYARGGFVGVLLEAYFTRGGDPLREPPTMDELKAAFSSHARAHFGPLLVLAILDAAVAVAAFTLPQVLPYFKNSLLGLVAFHVLTLFAPYVVVVERAGALRALRRSVRLVSDFLASTLVALLFGLLTMGGLAVVLRLLLAWMGSPGYLVAAVLVAPVTTVLSLFYLKVYLSMRPSERWAVPDRGVRVKSRVPAEA